MPANNKSGRTIKDFFKPFTIPKSRRPTEEADEIVVASSPRKVQTIQRNVSSGKQQQNVSSPKRGPGRPRKDGTASPSSVLRLSQARSASTAPTRTSPRKHVNGTGASSVASSGLTSIRSSQESTPTKIRRLQAVELPSPMKSTSPPPPKAQQPVSSQPPKNVNASFSSLSTLSSAPPFSSQSSSRRIIKNGVPAVTNSDSASMSSSDDELMDIDSFMPRKKRKVTPPPPAAANPSNAAEKTSTAKPNRTSQRLSTDNRRKRESWKPPSPPPITVTYKHSLLKMVKQNERQTATEARIAEAEASMREAELRREIEEKRAAEQETDGKSLAAAFAGDSDEGERMMMAMERTEALRGEESFYFFRGAQHLGGPPQLPSKDLDGNGLSFLKDPSKRRLACASGFLATVATQRGLPGFVAKWVQQSLLTEESEELSEAYVAILDSLVSSQSEVSEPIFSPSELYTGQTLRDAEETGRYKQDESARALPASLKFALRSMVALAPTITTDDQACAFAELVLLNIDNNIRKDVELQLCIERAMDAILESDNEEEFALVCQETIRQILHASILSRNMLARTATSLPASSLRLHQLRRKLALHILLDAPADEAIDTTSPGTSARLISQFKTHPDFNITENTNYTALISLTELIDIAIDNGFSDFTAPDSKPDTSADRPDKTLFANQATAVSPEEAAFNAQIDSLATQLRLMASTIRDAGTSHLKRTEAKSALERLIVRLESAVRTRSKPRKGLFGMGNGNSKAMSAFLGKGDAAKPKKRKVEFAGLDPKPEAGSGDGGDAGLVDGDISVIDENKLGDQPAATAGTDKEMDAVPGADENAQT